MIKFLLGVVKYYILFGLIMFGVAYLKVEGAAKSIWPDRAISLRDRAIVAGVCGATWPFCLIGYATYE